MYDLIKDKNKIINNIPLKEANIAVKNEIYTVGYFFFLMFYYY